MTAMTFTLTLAFLSVGFSIVGLVLAAENRAGGAFIASFIGTSLAIWCGVTLQ